MHGYKMNKMEKLVMLGVEPSKILLIVAVYMEK